MLQRHRRERDKAIGMSGHPFRQPLVLDLHYPAGKVAIGRIPPVAIDAQRLKIESLFVHDAQTLRAKAAVRAAAPAPSRIARQVRPFDDVRHLRHGAMTVNIDHLDAPASHEDLPAHSGSRLRRSDAGICDAAFRHKQSSRRARHGLEEIPAIRHRCDPSLELRPDRRPNRRHGNRNVSNVSDAAVAHAGAPPGM